MDNSATREKLQGKIRTTEKPLDLDPLTPQPNAAGPVPLRARTDPVGCALARNVARKRATYNIRATFAIHRATWRAGPFGRLTAPSPSRGAPPRSIPSGPVGCALARNVARGIRTPNVARKRATYITPATSDPAPQTWRAGPFGRLRAPSLSRGAPPRSIPFGPVGCALARNVARNIRSPNVARERATYNIPADSASTTQPVARERATYNDPRSPFPPFRVFCVFQFSTSPPFRISPVGCALARNVFGGHASPMLPVKRDAGPNALRRGRFSAAHATYFLTICVRPRVPALTGSVAEHITSELHDLGTIGGWFLRCAIVMPDHVHALVTLGDRFTLSQAIARLKFRTRPVVFSSGALWQTNFYDHRLRASDSVEDVLRYIWLNPYAAGLLSSPAKWPYFYCASEDWAWFEPVTNSGLPFPEWLR